MERHGRVLRGAVRFGEVRQGYLIKIMSGITTSETMAGEQPKDDNLGSRVDELTNEVDKLRNKFNVLEKYVLDNLEDIEKKINDE